MLTEKELINNKVSVTPHNQLRVSVLERSLYMHLCSLENRGYSCYSCNGESIPEIL
jgi:hypothetical protein